MAYPDREDVVAASTVDELTGLTTDQQDALYYAAISAIEDFTGQSFTEFTGARTITGAGGTEQYLDRRLQSVTAWTLDGVELDLTALAISEGGDRIYVPTPVPSYGVLTPEPWGEAPRRLRGDLEITGVWGWSDPPEAVVEALRLDMEDTALAEAHALSASVHAARKLGIDTIRQGNLDVALRDVPTLSPRVTRLLEPYVWLGAGGHLV
jgi:hypothetical protein